MSYLSEAVQAASDHQRAIADISQGGGEWAPAHPALERAERLLARRFPALTGRARAALDVILEGVRRSPWPDVAWEFSLLTEDGFPLEFSFSSAGEMIRYTAEVAGPELAEAERLRRAAQLLARLGKKVPSAGVMTLLETIQKAVPLRYGAWIGGRHGHDGDKFKLYAEVPNSGAADSEGLIRRLSGGLWGSSPLLPRGDQGAPRLMMVGHEPESSRIELYFSVEGLEAWEVGWMMRRAGLASREAELLGLIEETYGRPVERRLPGSRLGFSFSIVPDGADVASMKFSIFCYAGSVCGGDGSIRRKLLSLAQSRCWDFGSYESLSEPVAGRSVWMTYHTMLTFSVAAEGATALHIGLRPPAPQVG